MTHASAAHPLPGQEFTTAKAPGHWLLARMGKRVLRPGGLELTNKLLGALAIGAGDRAVEFAPGLGHTARRVLAGGLESYVGIEREPNAQRNLAAQIADPRARFVLGSADSTGLPDSSATVVWGEAMLSMQTTAQKAAVIAEACRILEPGGRYGMHELCLMPDDIAEKLIASVQADLASVVHHGIKLLTIGGWRALLHENGLEPLAEFRAPMHLVEPRRMISDEGLPRALRIMFNIIRDPAARSRVLAMRGVFRKYEHHLQAVAIVAKKVQK